MRTLNDYFLMGEIADVASADQVLIPVPDTGRIVGLFATVTTNISAGTNTLTLKSVTAAGTATAMTGGTLALGTSIGPLDTASATYTTQDNTETVLEGGAVEVETDGSGTGGGKTTVVVVIRR